MSDQPCRDTPCQGCALSEGAAANLEPKNHLTARLCVLGAIPFYCHEGFDWRAFGDGSPMPGRTREQVRALGMTICRGWKREVKALAATGYYGEHGEAKRAIASFGIAALNKFAAAAEGSGEKEDALVNLRWAVEELGEQKAQAPSEE